MSNIEIKLKTQNSKLRTMYTRLVRWAFGRFYREFAWTYDIVAAAVSRGRWAAWGRAALPYLRGRTLELGCGTGALQPALAERLAGAPIGLDASAQMLDRTKRTLTQAGQPVSLVRALAQSLPFPPAAFDSIVATFPSEYIADPATLAEARRVLRPRGRLVIALAAAFEGDGLYERLVGLAYRLTLQRPPRAQPDVAPRSVVGERLAQAGFEVEERWGPAAGDRVHLIIATRP
ncbi:MAG: class I SAM-dependent methyltransferase [Roseiflexaceae bacterium]